MTQIITNTIFDSNKSDVLHKNNKTIELKEVSWHDTRNDCWIIVYDRVYDITDFLNEHPGGDDILLEHAGRDATIAFRGTGHSAQAVRALDKYFIGELPLEERLFRKPNGIKLGNLPI
ncbi:hypothetical protein ABEB36_011821 [Hypothenemus hampei]|uniref:Cytochrome b5 heme-binding domain-containing protein n=1 Tax=Hypothenemus hampei TaxID=57062 RepID=A0ABD1E947_HYPHA